MILVTGAAGFVGSHLAERLVGDGHDVRGVDCYTPYYDVAAKRANVVALFAHPQFELVQSDLRHDPIAPLLDGVDTVFHQAAQPGVRASWSDGFGLYAEHNILATERLLEGVRDHGGDVARFVYASSSSVYGNADRYPCDEAALPAPFSPYGVTKLAGEHLCRAYAANYGVPTVALRYFTVYGPRQRPDMAFHRMIEAALGRSDAAFPLYGDGSAVRDFTYVDDVVESNLLAATAAVEAGAVFNVAGGTSTTVADVLELVGTLVGRPVPVDRRRAQPGDVHRTGGATQRITDALGWRPAVDLETGLGGQVEWHRQRPQ